MTPTGSPMPRSFSPSESQAAPDLALLAAESQAASDPASSGALSDKSGSVRDQHIRKKEERISAALPVWKEILADFARLKESPKTARLWWAGVPSSVRPRLWKLAVPNPLNISHELFEIHVAQAARARADADAAAAGKAPPISDDDLLESKMESLKKITLDLHQSFAAMKLFEEGGPFHEALRQVLEAHVVYRPDLGFVRGMTQIAAMLLLNMDAPDAFVAFANVLNFPCLRAFFGHNVIECDVYFVTFERLLEEYLPKLNKHLTDEGVIPQLFLMDWIMTVYSKTLPLEVASHVWDVYLLEGEHFLFRTALGILHYYRNILYTLDFEHCLSFLSSPPQVIDEALFASITAIQLNDKKFAAVLQRTSAEVRKK
eukprot:m51a1_g8763 putative tbc1 domain family member 12 isoform x2 (373) ;mRNA; f:139554-141268